MADTEMIRKNLDLPKGLVDRIDAQRAERGGTWVATARHLVEVGLEVEAMPQGAVGPRHVIAVLREFGAELSERFGEFPFDGPEELVSALNEDPRAPEIDALILGVLMRLRDD